MFDYTIKKIANYKHHEVFYGGQIIGMIQENEILGVMGTLCVQSQRKNGDHVQVTRVLEPHDSISNCFAAMQKAHDSIIEEMLM